MKYISSSLGEASGSLAGITGLRSKGGSILRAKAGQTKTRKPAQLLQVNDVVQAIAAWKQLTASQQQIWKNCALQNWSVGNQGRGNNLTGQGLFVSTWVLYLNAGATMNPAATPITQTPAPLPILGPIEVDYQNGAIDQIQITLALPTLTNFADDAGIIWVSKYRTRARNVSNIPLSIVVKFSNNETQPVQINTYPLPTLPVDNYQIGETIRFRMRWATGYCLAKTVDQIFPLVVA